MIDLEFSEKDPDEKLVREAWKIYLDQLNEVPRNSEDPTYQTKLDTWTSKRRECLVDLLSAMSQLFGYLFDKVHLKRPLTYPRHISILKTSYL